MKRKKGMEGFKQIDQDSYISENINDIIKVKGISFRNILAWEFLSCRSVESVWYEPLQTFTLKFTYEHANHAFALIHSLRKKALHSWSRIDCNFLGKKGKINASKMHVLFTDIGSAVVMVDCTFYKK